MVPRPTAVLGVSVLIVAGAVAALFVADSSSAARDAQARATFAGGIAPAWSANGEQIAYLGPLNTHAKFPTEVIVMRRDGSNKHAVLTVGRSPLGEVRFDGERLIYSIEDSGLLRGFTPSSGKKKLLGTVDLPPNPEEPFTISAKTGAIAFESGCHCQYPASVIRIFTAGRSTARTLPQPENVSDAQPSFSPDGKSVVFARTRLSSTDQTPEGQPKLMVSDLSGTSERSLGVSGELPRWSPDGKWIAYSGSSAGRSSINVVPAAGGKPHVLLRSAPGLDSFSWSPSSKALVYETRTGLGTISLSGARRAFRTPGLRPGFSSPQWSPDGKTILFWGIFGSQGYDAGIYTIVSDGKGLRRLA